jgi:hypothetical protein
MMDIVLLLVLAIGFVIFLLARIGPATYRTTTQEDQVRREANTQVDEHLKASAQVVESAPRTLSRWRHGFKSHWNYQHLGWRRAWGETLGDSPPIETSLNRVRQSDRGLTRALHRAARDEAKARRDR